MTKATKELVLHTTHKVGGRDRPYARVIVISAYETTGWLVQLLEEVAQGSVLKKVHNKTAVALIECVRRAEQVPKWIRFASQPAELVDAKQLIGFYHRIERGLLDRNNPRNSSSLCAIFRQHVRAFLVARKNTTASTLFRRFRTQLSFRTDDGRKSISELSDPGSTLPPLGAIRHSNFQDLKRKSLEKREDFRMRLENALTEEINEFCKHSARLIDAEAKSIDSAHCDFRGKFIVNKGPEEGRSLGESEYDDIYGNWAKIVRVDSRFRNPKFRGSVSFVGGFATLKHFWKLLSVRASFWNIYFYPEFGNARLLTVCIQILLLETGWNKESVIALCEMDVMIRPDGTIRISSIKERTDSDTPVCELDSKSELAVWAIHFLIARRNAMQREGIPAASSLFSSATSVGPVTSIYVELKKFQERHKLPIYSFEQIRKEVLGYINATKGLEATRRVAAHAAISQTGIYIDDAIERELNNSINFEFEHRLESDVRKAIIDGRSARHWPSLTPIGDGSSCIDPHLPPVQSWLRGEICSAEHCHSDSCPNRRILISTDRMQELAHTEYFYQLRWNTLRDRNMAKFDVQHLPKLLFVKALSSILLTGPYSKAYTKIRIAIREDI